MHDFLNELLTVVLPSIGIIALKDIIQLIYKYFKVPLEIRKIKKHNRHQEKANKLKQQIKVKELPKNEEKYN